MVAGESETRHDSTLSRYFYEREKLIKAIFSELGLTVSELVSLKLEQIDLKKKTISLRNRILSIPAQLIHEIKSYIDEFRPEKFLFFTRQSSQITPRRVQQILLLQKATPSQLRKQAISKKLEQGIPVDKVKEFAGLKLLDKKEFLTEDEFRAFYSSISSKRDRLIVSLLYETGMTLTQLSHLTVSSISKDFVELIPDTRFSSSQERVCRISTSLSKSIQQYISQDLISRSSYLFQTRQSTRISERRIQQLLKYYSNLSGSRITVSSTVLRNSYINHRIRASGITSARDDLGFKELRIYNFGILGFAPSGSKGGGHEDTS